MQKTAYDDLENALNGSFNHEQQVMGHTPMKGGSGGPTAGGSIGSSGGRPHTS